MATGSVILPRKSNGWRSLVGCMQSMGSLRVGHGWVTSLSLFLSCIGEGNGNPLQYFYLENPGDGGVWWATVYGVAQSWTWLKQLSSSNSSYGLNLFNLRCLLEIQLGLKKENSGAKISVRINRLPLIFSHDPGCDHHRSNYKVEGLNIWFPKWSGPYCLWIKSEVTSETDV